MRGAGGPSTARSAPRPPSSRRVASSPSRPGIRMSVSTTSDRRRTVGRARSLSAPTPADGAIWLWPRAARRRAGSVHGRPHSGWRATRLDRIGVNALHLRRLNALQTHRLPDPTSSHETRANAVLRPVVFGANDGLVSNLALVMGVAGANAAPAVIVLAGIAGPAGRRLQHGRRRVHLGPVAARAPRVPAGLPAPSAPPGA